MNPWMKLATCAALAVLGGEASAQTTDPAYAEARARFDDAVGAVRAGRPADAVGLFERSYATRATPVVAVNLAFCLRGLGRFGDARRWYERFLETATPDDLTRHEATVRAHLDEISPRASRITAGDATPPTARLLLDGAPLPPGARWINAGEHRAVAHADGYVPGSLAFTARGGEVVRLSTRLTVVRETPSIIRQWWFWTVVGVAVAGVAAAVVAPLVQAPPAAFAGDEVQVSP